MCGIRKLEVSPPYKVGNVRLDLLDNFFKRKIFNRQSQKLSLFIELIYYQVEFKFFLFISATAIFSPTSKKLSKRSNLTLPTL